MADYEAIPEEFKKRDQWLLFDTDPPDYADDRQPHWRGDFGISWPDPDDWHSFEEAIEAARERESWGVGYVMAHGNDRAPTGIYACIDVDSGLDSDGEPEEWVPDLAPFLDAATYVERSASGTGLHIPIYGQHVPNWWKDSQFDEHTGVDVLTNKFCVFTGDKLDASGDSVADVDPTAWLFDAYQAINGEHPRIEPSEDSEGERYDGDEWLEADDIEDALSHIDADVEYPTWRDIGFAIHSFDDGSTGRRLFEQWSRTGSKWDDRAESYIDAIWQSADSSGGVQLGTLIYHAREGGWSMPTPEGKPRRDGGTQTESLSGSGPAGPDGPPEPGDESDGIAWTDVAIIQYLGYDPEETTLKDIPKSELAYAIDSLLEKDPDWDMRVVNDDTEDIFTLDRDSKIWHQDGERKLKQVSRRALEQFNSKKAYNELVHASKSNPAWEIEREDLGGPEGYLAVENGLLNLLDRGPEPRDPKPEDYILGSIPTRYDPAASIEGTAFDDYILQSVAPRDRDKLQEYAGYCLWHRGQPFKKACFLFGPTDSGKGTFLKTVELILGPENIAWESLFNLIKTRWGRAKLYGKMVNMRNEVTAGGLSNLQLFKELTGGEDKITAENKNEPTFHFRVTQKFLFSTNQFPQLENADEAFFNRCLFVEFPNTVRDEDKDTELLDKFDSERSAILNWMLDGLDRLFDQGQFTRERSIDEKRDVTKSFGSPVEQFAYDALEVTGDPEDVVNKSELYQAFTRFCDYIHAGETPIQQAVTTGLKEIPGVDDGKSRRVSDGDGLDRCMKGIRLRPEFFKKIQADLPAYSHAEEAGGRSGGQTRLD